MADVPIRPLLAHAPERTPPGSWRLFLLPVLMALAGIFIATSFAKDGQRATRARDYADMALRRETVKKELETARDPERIKQLNDRLLRLNPVEQNVPSYHREGRQFTQWDGYRYEEIIVDGYVYANDDSSLVRPPGATEARLKNVVWYPLYPLLGAAVMKVTGIAAHDALTAVSWMCVIGAAVLFFAVARRHYFNRMPDLVPGDTEEHVSRRWDIQPADTAALWAVAFLLYGPASIFLYANYTESLFVMLLAAFLYAVQGRNWWIAALVAAVAASCRSQGVLFGPILALAYLLRSEQKNVAIRVGTAFCLGVISSIGLLAYMTYLGYKFGDPLCFMSVQKHWNVGINGRTVSYALNPVNGLANFLEYVVRTTPDWPRIWESFCVIFPPVLLMLLGARFLSFELEAFGWILWGLPYVSNCLAGSNIDPSANPRDEHWMSMGRFMSVVLPLQVIVGAILLRFRWLGPVLLAMSAAMFALFSYKFGQGLWVG